MIQHEDGRGVVDGPEGPDPVLARSLEQLDPARRDPMYWFRFRDHVLSSSARELARRRLMSELTVSDMLASWGRTLVPTALLAAAVAAFLLMRSEDVPSIIPLAVEELLVEGIGGAPIPTVLTSEDQITAGGVMIAVEAY